MKFDMGSTKSIRKGYKRFLSILLILLLMSNCISYMAKGAEIKTGEDTSGIPLKDKYTDFNGKTIDGNFGNIKEVTYYNAYLEEKITNKNQIAKTMEISLGSIKEQNGRSVEIMNYEGEDAFFWDSNLEYITFDVDMPQEGTFLIELDYCLVTGNSVAGKRTIYLDGEYPFLEANDLVFYRYFKDKSEPVRNSLGNETRPSQIEIPGYRTQKLTDTSGLITEYLQFYLDKGKHTIRMDYIQGDMAVSGIRLTPMEKVFSYEEVKQEYIKNGYTAGSETIDIQAELTAIEKNDPTLRRENDGDPLTVPHSATERLLNVMGAYRWRTGNQKITWEIEVPEDGLYKIGVRAKQEWQDGVPSYRQIEIDGKVPFQELLNYKFEYSTKWNTITLEDEKEEPFEFYLTKGRHKLSMTAKFGPLTPIIESINTDIEILSSVLLNITLIAGNTPDPNYDYGFFHKIPDLKYNLEYLIDSMQWKYDELKRTSDKLPAMANNFLTIKVQLEGLINDPFSIARKIGDLQGSQESLSTWFLELQKSPLVIDYFKIGPATDKWSNRQSNVFQRIYATLKNLTSSFTKDYDNVGGILDGSTEITNTITVWIARGTEWAEVIKEMADEDFTRETGIAINVNVVPAGQLGAGSANALMLSVISGKAPDVALGVDVTSPVEFAIRDAVYDLSDMEDFAEIKNRFVDATLTPYEYQGGIYAIPETMDFNVMFYRKDILNQFGIQLPDTRQQLYDYVLPALYQNGLQYYFGRDFTQFLFQNEGEFYSEDGLKSALDRPQAYQAFKEYTELFTNYGVPEVANFYQYMRNGVMPLGIGNFALYMQLSVAAPELAGKWGIAPLPGILKQDGTIDRTAGAITAQGDVIMKQSKHPEDAWEFLKWWSSAEVQMRFANEVEALMGAEARWNTANKEAFLSLSWNKEDIEVITEQWEWAKETPVVLGGYFTARHLTNAWTTVVVSGGDVRDALEQAVKDINRELRMKQEEYGVIIKD
jgi:ABC-type glycerol-3-phosphate transport system substrate-binding protein